MPMSRMKFLVITYIKGESINNASISITPSTSSPTCWGMFTTWPIIWPF